MPSASGGDWFFENAAVTGDSRLPGCVDIRTDSPGVTSTATLVHPIGYGAGHAIDSVTLTFRYLAGYDSGPGDWPVLSLELVDAGTGALLRTVYTSPPLDKYKWDSGDMYSPPIVAGASGLAVPNSDLVLVRVSVQNNARNVQIPLDPYTGLNVTIGWIPTAALALRHSHSRFGMGLDDL